MMLILKRNGDGWRIFSFQFKSPVLTEYWWLLGFWATLKPQQTFRLTITQPCKQKAVGRGPLEGFVSPQRAEQIKTLAFEYDPNFLPSFALSSFFFTTSTSEKINKSPVLD